MVAVAEIQEVVAEVPLQHLKAAQYLPTVQRAIAKLHWYIIGLDASNIVCQTPGDENTPGYLIYVNIIQDSVTIRIRPLVEGYWSDTQSRQLAELFKQAIAQAIEEQEKADRNLHPMHREKYGALIPSKSYLVTPLLVYANVLVYIAMVLSGVGPLNPTTASLYQWGGNFLPAVTHGEWWRLFTYMFLHGGAFHILMNMFALLYIGMFLEPLMGRFRFAAAYILTGICAGLLSIAVHSFSVGVGASGAIFGMYGVFLSMLTTSHIQKTLRKTMMRSILFFVVLNLLYGLQGNTDNAAHIGGLICGLIIGYAYYPGINKHAPLSRQLLTTAIITAFVMGLTVLSIMYLKAGV